ncbi:MAG: TonB-dependent receptor [Candidatus Aminicenantes bacterium]
MRKFITMLAIFAVVLLLSEFVYAQESTGRIVGTVNDDQGTPLPGVSISATSPNLVGEATAITAGDGSYRLLALPPGQYQVVYTLSGFKTVVREDIILQSEQTVTLDIDMEMGVLEESITVRGETPLIDVKSTSKGMTFDRTAFQRLPKSRDFESLAATIPGVNEEPLTGGGLSVDGATGSENVFYVDGMDITELDRGRKGQEAAFEFIEEVQMKASGYQAEFGGAIGGVLNVITRSGGNEFSGELMGYYSGSMFTGKERDTLRLAIYGDEAEYVNYQDLYGKDELHRIEAGFNLGGYIIKDKVWFFASFLPVFRNTTRNVEWQTFPPVADSSHTRNESWYNGSFKLTTQPVTGLRVSASFMSNFNKYRGDLPARAGTDNPEKEWGLYGFDYPNFSGNFTFDYTMGNNFLISGRFGMFSEDTTNQQVLPEGPLYRFRHPTPGSSYGMSTTNSMFSDIPEELVKPRGWMNYGYYDSFVTNQRLKQRQSANLNFTYYINLAGEHSWKAGVQWVRLHQNIDDTIKYPYFQFGWDSDFQYIDTGERVRGEYGYYAVRGGEFTGPYGTFAEVYSNRWAFFIQDSWSPEFARNLTLNIGVRMESEDIPSYSDLPEYQDPPIQFGFGDKIAPRLGFVYDVFGDTKTKIFGSFGYYYDVMKLEMAVGAYGGFKWKSDYYTLDHYDWTLLTKENPGALGTYLTTYNWRIPSFDTTDPELKPMSQSEFTFGFEQQIVENLSGSIRIVYKHLIRAIEDVGIITPFGEEYYTTNPGYGYSKRISEGGLFADYLPPTPLAKRDYLGINFNFERRFADNWMAGVSYTYSQLRGNYDGLSDRPNVNRVWDLWYMVRDQNMNVNNGPLTTDRPHQLKAWGSYVFPFDLTIGFFASGMSGVPVNRSLGVPEGMMIDGRLSDGRTPFIFLTNLYAEYNFRLGGRSILQFNCNVDNLFDVSTARRIYSGMATDYITLTDELLAQGFTVDANNNTLTDANGMVHTYNPDPRFLKEYDFYGPISVRFGMKFIF